MNFDKIIGIFSGLTILAIVSTLAYSPNTVPFVRAIGDTYADGVRAAKARV